MLRPTLGLGLIDKIAKGILYITGFLVVAYALLRWVVVPAAEWFFLKFLLWLSEDIFIAILDAVEATAPVSTWVLVSALLAGMWLFYRSLFRFWADFFKDKE